MRKLVAKERSLHCKEKYCEYVYLTVFLKYKYYYTHGCLVATQ